MCLLTARDLVEHVVPDRLHKETGAGFCDDRHEPWRYQHNEPDHAGDRPQQPQPARRFVDYGEDDDRKPDEHGDQRSLEQHTGGDRSPQNGGPDPPPLAPKIPPAGRIKSRHRPPCPPRSPQQHYTPPAPPPPTP